LLAGTYEVIQDGVPEEWKGLKLLRFKPRDPDVAFKERQRSTNTLRWAMSNIRYRLISGWTEPETGLPSFETDGTASYTDGHTVKVVNQGDRIPTGLINVNMAFQDLMPLMRKDFTSAERKQAIFSFTVTLLHETCVSH
jgi:hypothetical protein